MGQEHPEDKTKKHLIFCGSSSLSEKQKRLPAIYGENLGIVVALEKCRFWLRGCPHFWIYTDNRSLESIYERERERESDNERMGCYMDDDRSKEKERNRELSIVREREGEKERDGERRRETEREGERRR